MNAADLDAQVDSAMDPNHPPCAVFLEVTHGRLPGLSVISENSYTIFPLIFQVPHREIGGEVTPWADIQALRSTCDARDLHLHCDGARLWEALPYYQRTNGLSAPELCAAFDSV